MVGIEGGIPNKEYNIRLGDVVVSKLTGTFENIIQCGFGKTVKVLGQGHVTVSRDCLACF
jgi:hypothetical protein